MPNFSMGQYGSLYFFTLPISMACPTWTPLKYSRKTFFSIPAKFLVCLHSESKPLEMTDRTSNSATTCLTGMVAYTSTTFTDCANFLRRNSNRFSPLRIAEAKLGLIDNNACVRFGKADNGFELLARDLFKPSRC